MKKLATYILALISALTISANASADNNNGVVLKKSLIDKQDGTYTIKLDAYVTGSSTTTVTTQVKPVDLILVLDVSGSMDNDITVYGKNKSVTSVSGTSNIYLLERNGETYFVKYRNGNNNKYWYYAATASANDGTKYSAQSGDKLWSTTKTTQTKMKTLQDAVCAFIDNVSSNAIENEVDHRVCIIKYGSAQYYNNGNATTTEHNTTTNGSNTGYNRCEVVKRLTDVSIESNATTLKNEVKGFHAAGATAADYGMNLAEMILDEIPDDRESNKIVVMFTDGQPTHSSSFNGTVAKDVVEKSYTIKNTHDAKVYTIGVFDTNSTAVDNYMNYTSSNYPSARATGSTPTYTPGTANNDGVQYYRQSDGSNLTGIFESISNSSTSGSATITLGAETTSVVDKMSSNFRLPKNLTEEAIRGNVKVYPVSVVDITSAGVARFRDEFGSTYTADTYFDTETYGERNWDGNYSVTVKKETGEVIVSGFDYSLDDNLTTNPKQFGNWVGRRNGLNGNPVYGNKLVIEFDVELNPDYEGGYGVPSNDTSSGIYNKPEGSTDSGNGTLVERFEVPTRNFPSICIIKEGLEIGESAIFDISSTNGTNYRIVLTQKASKNNSKFPCYAVIKGIEGDTDWTVTETGWSWTYASEATTATTQTLTSLEDLNINKSVLASGSPLTIEEYGETPIGVYKELDGNRLYGILYRQKTDMTFETPDDPEDGAVVAIYRFTNTKSTSGLPARAEAYAHNKFSGGTAEKGGTENGTNEEEEI